jgi:type VI secretion system protein ImpG
MSDEQLEVHYQRELAYLRKLGAEFSESHPKIAARLKLGPEISTDPHVEHLIEAVAFLNARVRQKLDDDLPELTDSLLGFLYPHYLAPTPSMAIVQFECDPSLTTGYGVPAGTVLETEPVDGEPVRFRTTYPVTALPIRVATAALVGPPAAAPRTPRAHEAKGVLRIAIESRNDAPLAQLLLPKPDAAGRPVEPHRLRLFLKGSGQHVHELYELLFNNVLEAALATGPDDPEPLLLRAPALQPVGFSADEGMLPCPPRSFLGYQLLTELFAFPAKFLFFDVTRLDAAKLARCGRRLELFVYLSRGSADLEQNVRAESFALGCTPMVNLFPRRAEPVRLTGTDAELRVVADARRTRSVEVWSVDRVVATSATNERRVYLPMHGITHDSGADERRAFFTQSRRPATGGERKDDAGSEVWLALVDLDGKTSSPDQWVLDVDTTCSSRDLPNRLPFGGGQPRLRFSEGGGPIKRIECLTAPTPTRRPLLRDRTAWRLVSQLHLNHLSLSGPEGSEAFREILRLHDVGALEVNQAMIRGVLSLASRPVVLRIADRGEPGVCRGTEVTLHLDEARFSGGGLFLFACVVERFLGLYASLNSFIRLVVTTNRREGVLCRWPPRAGDLKLL